MMAMTMVGKMGEKKDEQLDLRWAVLMVAMMVVM